MKICPKCKQQYETGKFCQFCENEDGSPVKLEDEKITCPQCGLQYNLGTKFCSECGIKLGTSAGAATAGISVGDKNVIAGDVIGKKEENHISGNATFINNIDESGKMNVCPICGRNSRISESYTCRDCGKTVCKDCFDIHTRKCVNCVDYSKTKKIDEYKNAVLTALQNDGLIDFNERQELDTLAVRLNLSKEEKEGIEKGLMSTSQTVDLTMAEKISLKKAKEYIFELGDYKSGLNFISSLYLNHQDNQEILNLYLLCAVKTKANYVDAILNSITYNSVAVSTWKLENAFLKNDLIEAEKLLNVALKYYPNERIFLYEQVKLNNELFKQYKEASLKNAALDLFAKIPAPENDIERIICDSIFDENIYRVKNSSASHNNFPESSDVFPIHVTKSCLKSYITLNGKGLQFSTPSPEKMSVATKEGMQQSIEAIKNLIYQIEEAISKKIKKIAIVDEVFEKSFVYERVFWQILAEKMGIICSRVLTPTQALALNTKVNEGEEAKTLLMSLSEGYLLFSIFNIEDGIYEESTSITITDPLFTAKSKDLVAILSGHCARFAEEVERKASETYIHMADVTRVLVSGDYSDNSKVITAIRNSFGKLNTEKVDDFAVLRGLDVQCGILSNRFQGLLLYSCTQDIIGIETIGGVMTPIVSINTTIPVKKSVTFTTSSDNQNAVSVKVYVGKETKLDVCDYLGQFDLVGIPPARKGVPQIEISFDVDASGCIKVVAKDLGTGKTQSYNCDDNIRAQLGLN